MSGRDNVAIELDETSGNPSGKSKLAPPSVSFADTTQDSQVNLNENINDEIFEDQTDESSTKKNAFESKKRSKRSFKRFFSTNKDPRNGDAEHNLADFLLAPTQPKHLGIFQFMPFEHQEADDSAPVSEHFGQKEDKELTTKEKLRHILHSKALHLIIIILVLLDSILVIFELLFDLEIIGPEGGGELVIREVFHGFSVGILTMFMIELVLKLWADHRHFIRHKIEVLDGFVVVVSWVVDIALVFIDSASLLAIELLLLLRLWRVFRIVNGIIVAVKTKADERVHFFKVQNNNLQKKLNESEEKLESLQKDVRILKAKLLEHGIKLEENMI